MPGSFTWMLPLLLLSHFITFLHSTEIHNEFNIDLERFGQSVKHCLNCSSTLIECQCVNYSVSVDCGFPGYFIQGLRSLPHNIPENETVSHLIEGLEEIANQERTSGPVLSGTTFCYQSANPIISPKCLYEKLEQVRDYINSEKILSNASGAVKVDC